LISASTSVCIVDGFGFGMFFPLIILAVLIASYISYNKLETVSEQKFSMA